MTLGCGFDEAETARGGGVVAPTLALPRPDGGGNIPSPPLCGGDYRGAVWYSPSEKMRRVP